VADNFLSESAIKADATSVTVPVLIRRVVDGTAGNAGSAGISCVTIDKATARYWRQGSGGPTAITLSAATLGAAYGSGNWAEVDSVNMCGLYRLDVPNAMLFAAADWVKLTVTSSCGLFEQTYALPTYQAIASCTVRQVVETCGSYTLQQATSLILSATAGASSGGGTTRKTPDACTTRIVATIDTSSNRTAITASPSSYSG
jgi:hypothetical protein